MKPPKLSSRPKSPCCLWHVNQVIQLHRWVGSFFKTNLSHILSIQLCKKYVFFHGETKADVLTLLPTEKLETSARTTMLANSNGLWQCAIRFWATRSRLLHHSLLTHGNTAMRFTFTLMLRIISSAALSVNERPQQGAPENLLFYSHGCLVAISVAHYSV